MEIFGLIGEKLEHSFSKKYFNKKFSKLGLHENKYENFEINSLENLKKILSKNNIKGLNVTIPFKKTINEENKITYINASLRSINVATSISFVKNIEKINTPKVPIDAATKPLPPSNKPKASP